MTGRDAGEAPVTATARADGTMDSRGRPAGRAETIRSWIAARKERKEIMPCAFHITVPRNTDIDAEAAILKIHAMLDRNRVKYAHVDTVPGAWNLNRDWIETRSMNCIVEYCGVYPVNWDIDDVVELERMDTDGEVIILVDWIQNGKYVPNH